MSDKRSEYDRIPHLDTITDWLGERSWTSM